MALANPAPTFAKEAIMSKRILATVVTSLALMGSLSACGPEATPDEPAPASSVSVSSPTSASSDVEGSDREGYSQKVVDLMVVKGWTVTRYIGKDPNSTGLVYVLTLPGSTTCVGLRFVGSDEGGTPSFKYDFGDNVLISPSPSQLERSNTSGVIDHC